MTTRFGLAAAVVLLSLQVGCVKKSSEKSGQVSDNAAADQKIVVQLDWMAEPEHGGLYQAQAKGFFAAEGLDVVLLPGGTNVNPTQNCATGRADIAQADSTNTIVVINNQDLPIVQVAAVFQEDPSVLMLHPENPVNRFEDLNGKTLMARPQWAFLPYLKKKYKIDFQLTPQSFSPATFVANKDTIQQGYSIAEPYHIMKAGGPKPKFLFAHDAGFDAYAVLIANSDWAGKHPVQLKSFLRAYIKGWDDYLNGDPRPAHEALKKANANNTDEFMNFSRQMIIEEKLVTGRGSAPQIGRLDKDRFSKEIKQLEDLEIIQPAGKLTADRVMTLEYLP